MSTPLFKGRKVAPTFNAVEKLPVVSELLNFEGMLLKAHFRIPIFVPL